MGSTYHSVRIHAVFACKDRKPLITPHIKLELFKYIHGVCDKRQCKLIEGGGIADHVHLLIGLSMTQSIADLMRDIKTNTSRWIHEKWPTQEFGWQDGYGVFSVSASLLDRTRDYIRNQEQHHAEKTFDEELDEILTMHGMKRNADGSVSAVGGYALGGPLGAPSCHDRLRGLTPPATVERPCGASITLAAKPRGDVAFAAEMHAGPAPDFVEASSGGHEAAPTVVAQEAVEVFSFRHQGGFAGGWVRPTRPWMSQWWCRLWV